MKKKNSNYRRWIMHALSFILAISVALPAYIQSSYLKQYISLEVLSLFFVASNAITVLMIGWFPKIIRHLGNYFTAKIVMVLYGISLLGLVAANNATLAIMFLLFFGITSTLLWINIDILLEEASSDSKTGRIRTLHLTFTNLGWIIAPALSAYFVKIGGYSWPFLISAFLVIPLFFILISQRINLKSKKKYTKENLVKSFKKLWANKNLRGVFIAATLLNLFFSCAVIYIPIYLNTNLGISWKSLGVIFSFMLLPFILFEIPAGFLADKYFGEKEIMLIGLSIIFLSLLLFFTITTTAPWIWAIALFVSRIGAALLESMRDTYFFKNVNAKEIGYINIFRMTGPLGYLIGSATAACFLIFLPINYLFLIFAALLAPGFYYIGIIQDTK
jgi:MFS family permease